MIPATYTPDWLANDMANLCGISSGSYVLEPSAGRGALAQAARDRLAEVDCYELNEESCKYLEFRRFDVEHRDFLSVQTGDLDPRPVAPSFGRQYDRVLMNPPTKGDLAHVEHALQFLKPGGRLVALISAVRTNGEWWKLIHPSIRLYQIAYPKFIIDEHNVHAALLVVDV